MMLRRLASASALALCLLSSVICHPSWAAQSSLVTPGAPLPMTALAAFLNSALLSLGSCNSGPSAPTNGPGSTAFAGECWANTTTSTWVFSYTPDGVNWVQYGTLDTLALKWTPYLGGSPIAASSPVTYSVNAGLVTISCPTCLTAQNIPLGQKVGGLGVSPGGLLYSGPFGSRSMPTPFGIGQVPLSNGKNAPSWSQWTVPASVPAGYIFYSTLNNVFSAIALPACANDGAHALVFVSGTLVCQSMPVGASIATSSVLGNFSGGSAVASQQSVPSCAGDGAHALTNPAAGGFACQALSTGGAGFVNALRNASLTAWFHGSGTLTITTAGGWCAEGIYVKPTGASVTCQQTTTCPAGNRTFYCLKITSAASVTAIQVRFVVESLTAATLAGLQTTFQFLALNNCGSSVTPTIQALYPTAQDNYGATGTDLASVSPTGWAIANGASQIEAYSWQANANVDNGDSIDIGLGACGANAADSFTIGGGFDWRVTPSASTGTVASPPTPEIRDAESDLRWNQRFYAASYANGTAPAAATHVGMVGPSVDVSGQGASCTMIPFPAQMRAAPSVSFFDGAGTASKGSSLPGNVSSPYTDGVTMVGLCNIGAPNFGFIGSSTVAGIYYIHYTADASLTGAWLLKRDLNPVNDNAPAFMNEVA